MSSLLRFIHSFFPGFGILKYISHLLFCRRCGIGCLLLPGEAYRGVVLGEQLPDDGGDHSGLVVAVAVASVHTTEVVVGLAVCQSFVEVCGRHASFAHEPLI